MSATPSPSPDIPITRRLSVSSDDLLPVQAIRLSTGSALPDEEDPLEGTLAEKSIYLFLSTFSSALLSQITVRLSDCDLVGHEGGLSLSFYTFSAL